MTPQEVKIGTRLEFEMLGNNDERVGNTFVSQLLEHQADGSIIISAPITESRIIFVPIGIKVRLTFVHPQQGLLGLKALVRAKEYKGNIAVLIVEPEETIEKLQRREHYRLDIITDALIWPVPDDPENTAANTAANTWAQDNTGQAVMTGSHGQASSASASGNASEDDKVKAYTKNLSGSGACLVCEKHFPKNSEIMVELKLSGSIRIKSRCIVLRSQQIEVRRGKSYELGVHFTEISGKDQDHLIRYIFEQQRMLLKKEK